MLILTVTIIAMLIAAYVVFLPHIHYTQDKNLYIWFNSPSGKRDWIQLF